MDRSLTPRRAYSKELERDEELLTNLTMNFDPFTISVLKKEFEAKEGVLDKEEFILAVKQHLRYWKPSLPDRDRVMIKILAQLFDDIDINGNEQLDWDEFTNFIIEKAVIHGTEKKNHIDSIKNYASSHASPAFSSDSSIEKLINMEAIDRVGVIEDYSDRILFYNQETGQSVGRELLMRNDRLSKKVMVHNALYVPRDERGILLASCNDGTIRSFENHGSLFQPSHTETGPLKAENPQRSLAWNEAHQTLYSGDSTGVINMWRINDRSSDPCHSLTDAHFDMVTDLIAVSSLELLVSCSQDRNIILWDMISSQPRRVYDAHTKGILSLSFNQEYRLLFSAGFDHDIFVWNPYIDSVAFMIEGHNSSLIGVKSLPGTPQIVSADIDGWIKVWDIRNLSCVQTFNLEEKHSGSRFGISDFLYLEKKQRLVFGGRRVLFYDYDKNYNPTMIDDNPALSSFYSPHHHKILTAATNKVKVWNAFTGTAEHLYAMSPDSEISFVTMDEWQKRFLVGYSNGKTSVFNIKNGALMKELSEHKGEVSYITHSKSLQIIVTCSLDINIMVHEDKELGDTSLLKVFNCLGSIVTVLAVLPLRALLVTGNLEGAIQVWDMEDSKQALSAMTHPGEVSHILMLANSSLMISADSTSEVAIWAIDPSPYKYNCIFKWNHTVEEALISVTCFAYDHNSRTVFTADEKGYVTAFALSKVFSIYESEENSLKTQNKNHRKSQLSMPPIPEDSVSVIFQVMGHREPIRHLHLINEPLALLTTGTDRRGRIFDAKNGQFLGSLQQGLGSSRPPKSQLGHWGLTMDIEQFKERKEVALDEVCASIMRKESKSAYFENAQVYKGVASEFITSRNLKPESRKETKKSGVMNFYTTRLEGKPVKNVAHFRNDKRERTQVNRLTSLPQLQKPSKFLDTKKVALRKKLSKAALRSAARLAQAIEEPFL